METTSASIATDPSKQNSKFHGGVREKHWTTAQHVDCARSCAHETERRSIQDSVSLMIGAAPCTPFGTARASCVTRETTRLLKVLLSDVTALFLVFSNS